MPGRASKRKIVAPLLLAGGLLLVVFGLVRPRFFWTSGKFQRWAAEWGEVGLGRYFMVLGGILIVLGLAVLLWPARRRSR